MAYHNIDPDDDDIQILAEPPAALLPFPVRPSIIPLLSSTSQSSPIRHAPRHIPPPPIQRSILIRPPHPRLLLRPPIEQQSLPTKARAGVDYSIGRCTDTHGNIEDPLASSDSASSMDNEEDTDLLNPFISARRFVCQQLRYQSTRNTDPYIPLSFEEARKEKLNKLSPSAKIKVEEMEKELQKCFEDDCSIHSYFATSFISKNKMLENSIRNAMNETLKDLETKYLKELDIFTDLMLNIPQD